MPTYTDETAAARKVQKSERDRIRFEALQRQKAVQALYASKDGRAYLWWILKLSGALGQNPFRTDPLDTAFMCGQQNIGQQLMAHMIETSPDAFANLMKEQSNASRNRPDANGASASDDSDPDEPSLFAAPVESPSYA